MLVEVCFSKSQMLRWKWVLIQFQIVITLENKQKHNTLHRYIDFELNIFVKIIN